jgi:hypothetical protein
VFAMLGLSRLRGCWVVCRIRTICLRFAIWLARAYPDQSDFDRDFASLPDDHHHRIAA